VSTLPLARASSAPDARQRVEQADHRVALLDLLGLPDGVQGAELVALGMPDAGQRG
jgi:hypothetical protein